MDDQDGWPENGDRNLLPKRPLRRNPTLPSPRRMGVVAPAMRSRRGKPPSAKTWVIRRDVDALGGVAAADFQEVIARVHERDHFEVTGYEVSMQKTVLPRQAEKAARAAPRRLQYSRRTSQPAHRAFCWPKTSATSLP
jgi:hypothetical protein